jgi:hypothetical protein
MSITIPARSHDLYGWLERHGIDPKNVYRVEVTIPIDDAGHMTIYEYERDEHGKFFVDPVTQEPARSARTVFVVAPLPESFVILPGEQEQPDPPLHTTDVTTLPASNRTYLRKS